MSIWKKILNYRFISMTNNILSLMIAPHMGIGQYWKQTSRW